VLQVMKALDHRRLVEELAALSQEERRAVLREAEKAASAPAGSSPKPVLPWTSLRATIGIVHGAPADAVADCDRLYDG
jgi:hypothetical protein